MKKLVCMAACLFILFGAVGCTCRDTIRPMATVAPSPTQHVTERPVTPEPVVTVAPQVTENPELSPGVTDGAGGTGNTTPNP